MKNIIASIACVLAAAFAFGPSVARAADGSTYAAYVTVGPSGASFIRKAGAVSVKRTAAGQTEVIFKKDVSACYYQATTYLTGQTAVQPLFSDPKGVFVATQDSAGSALDRRYMLTVFCPE